MYIMCVCVHCRALYMYTSSCMCTLQGAVQVYIICVYITGSCTSLRYMCILQGAVQVYIICVYIAGSCTSVHYMCVHCRELYKCTLCVCTLQGAVQVNIMCVYIAGSCVH